jgi:hypothetical protein
MRAMTGAGENDNFCRNAPRVGDFHGNAFSSHNVTVELDPPAPPASSIPCKRPLLPGIEPRHSCLMIVNLHRGTGLAL